MVLFVRIKYKKKYKYKEHSVNIELNWVLDGCLFMSLPLHLSINYFFGAHMILYYAAGHFSM